MYVTTRPIRLSGIQIPYGYKVPEDIKVPSHLLQSGWVVELPDEIGELTRDDVKEEKPAKDPDPVEEKGPDPVEEKDPEPDKDPLDINDYHVGGGWYEIDGKKYRREDAEVKLQEG